MGEFRDVIASRSIEGNFEVAIPTCCPTEPSSPDTQDDYIVLTDTHTNVTIHEAML